MIEIDLHRTRDGALVVTHDAELEWLGGEGEIAGASLSEVRALDAGDGQPVPTLDEVLDRFGSASPSIWRSSAASTPSIRSWSSGDRRGAQARPAGRDALLLVLRSRAGAAARRSRRRRASRC